MPADPFADMPKDVRRKLKRALKLRAYTDIFGEMESDKWMGQIAAFSIQMALVEDPDLVDLEMLRDMLIDFGKRLRGHADGFQGCPWARFPRDLGHNGHLAQMSAGEVRVYMALLCLCDPRTLVTCASVEVIADMVGRSWETVSENLTKLKKRGLIRRWCKKHPNPRDEAHYIWFARIVPEACCETEADKGRLRGAAMLPALN